MDLAQAISRNVHVCTDGPWMIPESATRPTGAETGDVLVIGVGGSTLRVTRVSVRPGSLSRSDDILIRKISNAIRSHPKFFNWCADQIVPVLDRLPKHTLALSWSFPLLNGKILSMGKHFTSIFNGQNLLELFNSALPAKYSISSATHDGTSSLVSGAYNFPKCTMALTWGTGVNINLIDDNGTFINSEISMLGRQDITPGFELTKESWDATGKSVDLQPFEAQIGGLWLGEMASTALDEKLTTRDLGEILQNTADLRYKTVHKIVSRATSLVAAAIYGLQLAFSTPKKTVMVAYTGGVVFDPMFRSLLEIQLRQLAEIFKFRVVLTPQKHGSEVGAAIAALTEHKN